MTRVEPDFFNPPGKTSVDECSVPARISDTVWKTNVPWQVDEMIGREGDADSAGMVLLGTRGECLTGCISCSYAHLN